MLLPCRARGIVEPVIWNELDKNAAFTISGAGFVISSNSAGDVTARATKGLSDGKVYFECTFANMGSDWYAVGVANASQSLSTYLGQTANGWSYFSSGFTYNGGSSSGYGSYTSASDVISCAVDFGTGKIWWAKNNTWGASGNPAAGTGARYSNISGKLFPALTHEGAHSQATTINLGLKSFVYTPPSGFIGWQQATR